jgi:glycosyltransferase involved in cell wall biosynthesis
MAVEPGTGFGDAAEAYLSGLRTAAVPVSWIPMGWGSRKWGDPRQLSPVPWPPPPGTQHADIAGADVNHDVVVVHTPPLWHQQLATQHAQLVAYTAWEADAVPRDRVELLNHYSKVLVPSQFTRDVLVSSGVHVPIVAVPHIARERALGPPLEIRDATPDTYVFCVIGTWCTRKAMDETVVAYLDAFTDHDDVLLVVKTTPEDHLALARNTDRQRLGGQHAGSTWLTLAKLLAGRRKPPRLHLITDHWPRSRIDALHARTDCYVCLSRGEAWGLTTFDAAAHATPVVVTGWGGSIEFLPRRYPYLVEYDLIPTNHDRIDDWIELAPDRRWARARHDHAVQLLSHAYHARDEARMWGRQLQRHVTRTFASEVVTPRLLAALRP